MVEERVRTPQPDIRRRHRVGVEWYLGRAEEKTEVAYAS
jgi:hypothetical protein